MRTFSCQLSKTAELASSGLPIPLYKYFINTSCSSGARFLTIPGTSAVRVDERTSMTEARVKERAESSACEGGP